MEKNKIKEIIEPYIKLDLIVMVLISLAVLYLKIWWGVICLIAVVAVTIYHTKISSVHIEKQLSDFKARVLEENDEITRSFVDASPVFMCISDIAGNLSWANEGFRSKVSSEGSIKSIVSEDVLKKLFANEQYERIIEIKESKFRVSASSEDEAGHSKRMLYFEDVTAAEIVRDLFKDSRPSIIEITVDNFEELLAASPVEKQSKIAGDIESILREWIAAVNGSITKIKANHYLAVCEHKDIEGFKKDKFSIMEKIHGVETEADFPTTISMGIGTEAANLSDLQDFAYQALDLALGRGGDQVVIKKSGNEIEYYGGSLGSVERRNKGKSRIMSHALIQLIKDSDKVLVMGHKRPDLDSLGSAIGVAAFAMAAKKKAYIVLNGANEAIDLMYNAAVGTNRFEFIGDETAMALVKQDTLLVIVDTHIGPMTESPALLDKCKKLVVIDHHRKSANAIENTMLTYMEPYASSASEQVCELLQYADSSYEFEKFEMNALLAGITLDTKNFTQNTGVRSFESAGWLRRKGADTKKVMSYFKMRLDFYQKKVNMIASAEILGNGIAVAYTRESDPSMQVLAAQAADELLEMRGIETVFVAGGLADKKTTISARSTGDFNVQSFMEKLGGGGHINAAAAQLEEVPELAIQKIVAILRDEKLI